MKRTHQPLLIAAILLAALPVAFAGAGLSVAAATDVVIFAVAATGIAMLIGTAGLVSFAHGAFFGLAAYAAALAQRHWFPGSFLLPSVVAVASAATVAVVAGFLMLRRRGVYFPLLTLVLTAAAHWSAMRWAEATEGLVRTPVLGLDLAQPWSWYATVAAIGMAVVHLSWRFRNAPVGSVLVAIRRNEQRARAIGYPAERYKLIVFTWSAAIAAIAGVLSGFQDGTVSADIMSVQFSGALVAMGMIGGMKSFFGPALGALAFVLFREFASIVTPHWVLLFSLVFLGGAALAPNGLVGIAAELTARWRARPIEPSPQPERLGTDAIALPRWDRPGPASLLVVRDLRKSFGPVHAVRGIGFAVEGGAVHALVGANGAGKTTVLDLISGICPPDDGFISLDGRSITGRRPERIATAGVGRSFETANLFAGLTVEENVRLAVLARHRKRFALWTPHRALVDLDAETAQWLASLGLTDVARLDAASLPLEARRLVDLALALAARPRVLLLDEPLAGLRATGRARIAALVKSIGAHMPVLLVERDLDSAIEIADRVIVMSEGKIRFDGSAAAARGDARLNDVQLGEGDAEPRASAAGATPLLAIEKVDTFNGESRILDGVSLAVCEHEIVALIGRNGAGKSTLLKTILGIAPPRAGSIRLGTKEIAGRPAPFIARQGIGYVSQGRGLFHGMTVADNVALGRLARQTGVGVRWDDDRIFWVFPRLRDRWRTRSEDLPSGEQQMVAVARALSGDVRLLLLDEPFEGLSGVVAAELFAALDRLRYDIAILIADHGLDRGLALSDRVVVLESGRVTWRGASQRLREDRALRTRVLAT